MFLNAAVIKIEYMKQLTMVAIYFSQFSEVVSIILCADVVKFFNQQADVSNSITPKGVLCDFEES